MLEWFAWVFTDGFWTRVAGPLPISQAARRVDQIGAALGIPGRHQCLTAGGPPRFTPHDVRQTGQCPANEEIARKCTS